MVSLFSLLLAGAAGAQSENKISLGSRSDEVKAIQEVLKTDKSIYPEGLTTGYFGQATKKAVARVQAKCGLLQTGEVNEDTTKCIFPVNYHPLVISPNGGEIWDRGQIQTIKWSVAVPSATGTETNKMPFWSRASIDLFRRNTCTPTQGTICTTWTTAFVKHLATVDLFASSYSWKISSDIANGSDYVIRVSVGENIVPLYKYEKEGGSLQTTEIWREDDNWDESDNPFTITGSVVPPSRDLSQVIKMLQEMADQLAKAIQLLRELNQTN